MGKKRIAEKLGEEVNPVRDSKLPQQNQGVRLEASTKEISNGVKEVVQEVPVQKGIREGRIYVYSSYNNTIITLTDLKGNVVASLSAGRLGFKGTKKSTPFAASKVADAIAQLAQTKGIARVEVFVKGVGAGRDSALRSLGAKTLEITGIRDVTPIPHNGPRAPKIRRV